MTVWAKNVAEKASERVIELAKKEIYHVTSKNMTEALAKAGKDKKNDGASPKRTTKAKKGKKGAAGVDSDGIEEYKGGIDD